MFRRIVTIRALGACIFLTLAAASLNARSNDDSSRYVVKTDSLIEFRASATLTKVVGVFHAWEADFKMPGDKFTDAALVLEIDADSVATGSGAKDKEIKGKNFFAVKEHPQIRFVSKKVTADGESTKFRMEGELTVRGITQPVSVAIVVRPEEEGHQRIDGQFSFDRREFGMVHNVPFNKVANTVEVNFQLEVQNPSVVAQNVN